MGTKWTAYALSPAFTTSQISKRSPLKQYWLFLSSGFSISSLKPRKMLKESFCFQRWCLYSWNDTFEKKFTGRLTGEKRITGRKSTSKHLMYLTFDVIHFLSCFLEHPFQGVFEAADLCTPLLVSRLHKMLISSDQAQAHKKCAGDLESEKSHTSEETY